MENSPLTGASPPPSQRASDAENVSTWWRPHGSLPVWSASQSSNASMPSPARRYSKYIQDNINLHRDNYSQIYRDRNRHILALLESLGKHYISKVFKWNNNLWTKHIVSIYHNYPRWWNHVSSLLVLINQILCFDIGYDMAHENIKIWGHFIDNCRLWYRVFGILSFIYLYLNARMMYFFFH